MSKLREESLELDEEILKTFSNIHLLKSRCEELKKENKRKEEENQKLIEELAKLELKENEMCIKNITLRTKFNNLDENVKIESTAITEEIKTYFKKLGLRVTQLVTPDHRIELILQFTENLGYSITLIYDTITEDYDLLRLQPHHPRFDDIRQFLRDSQDIQGFLNSYRNLIKSKLNHEIEQNENHQ